jgi:SAM-dependent methyltransferase
MPDDHARQSLAEIYISAGCGRRSGERWRVLDLGCGAGDSVDFFRAVDPAVQWTGLDLPDSPEVRTRVRDDAEFVTFDGRRIPFAEGAFDLVYCKQVLEHVHRPEPLLAEVARVLRPGGSFAGSTSQLEPFHSFSTFNYTPLGLRELLRGAGLEPVEFRPGIDALVLIGQRFVGHRRPFDRLYARWWGNTSPLNRALDLYARVARLDPAASNAIKLLFCGQFTFLATRSGPPSA